MQFLLNHICLKCRAKLCSKTVTLYSSTSSLTGNGMSIAAIKQLGFTEDQANKLIDLSNKRKYLDITKLERVVTTVEKLGCHPGEIIKHPNLLKCASSIDHYYQILEESGFSVDKIKLEFLSKYPYLSKNPIAVLKDKGLIKEDINVARNILSYSDLPLDFYVPDCNDSQLLCEVQTKIIQKYLCWRLDIKQEEVEKLFRSYPYLINKSIRILMQVYNIMTTNIGLTVEKMRKNAYVFQVHPNQCLDLLERVPTIGNKPIQQVIFGIPKLVLSTTNSILEILRLLKEYGLTERDVVMHPRVLTLGVTTVRERLSYLHSDPNFTPFIRNNRKIKMVLHFNLSKNRTNQLKEKKWHCSTLELLSTYKKIYDRRIMLGADITTGSDKVILLEKELGLSKKELRAQLNKHPHWIHVSVSTVSHTLEFLRQAGIQKSQIINCLQVLLYQVEDVKTTIELLQTNPEVDCCRDSSGNVRPEFLLHLVHYFLERPYHFSGNGVWGDYTSFKLVNQ